MDDAIALVNAFLNDEHVATLAVSFEANYDTIIDHVRKVDSHFRLSSGISSGLGRPKYLPASILNRMKAQAELSVKRRCFAIQHYEQPDMGHLFRCLLSGGGRGTTEVQFAEMIWLGNLGEGLQIINRNALCAICNASGQYRGEKCPECMGVGWIHRGGVRILETGRLKDTLKFDPPTDTTHQELFEAL